MLDLAEVDAWVRRAVAPTGPIEPFKERAWATVLRVPTEGGPVWFKSCAPVQAFEPRLTAELARRWPDRVAEVLLTDEARGWLLTADAGTSIGDLGNAPELWERILPRYAEIQRGEVANAADHLAHGVPDQRLVTLPQLYDEQLRRDLPLAPSEMHDLRGSATTFSELCRELAARLPIETIQHDDLHLRGVFVAGEAMRVLDWGDASIGQPFFSLVVTFQFLREVNGLAIDDPWFGRLRDAYLEPWGSGHRPTFDLALRVGTVAHTFTWMRVRDAMTPADRRGFDETYPAVLRRAITALARA